MKVFVLAFLLSSASAATLFQNDTRVLLTAFDVILDADRNGVVTLREAACGLRVSGQPCDAASTPIQRDCDALFASAADLDDIPFFIDC